MRAPCPCAMAHARAHAGAIGTMGRMAHAPWAWPMPMPWACRHGPWPRRFHRHTIESTTHAQPAYGRVHLIARYSYLHASCTCLLNLVDYFQSKRLPVLNLVDLAALKSSQRRWGGYLHGKMSPNGLGGPKLTAEQYRGTSIFNVTTQQLAEVLNLAPACT